MKTRILALLLALTLSLGLFTGCGSKEETADTADDPAETPEYTGVELDPTSAYGRFSPTDVVMTVNGSDVCWPEFFNGLYGIVYQIQYYNGGLMDWAAACIADNSVTNSEYAWQYAVDTCLQYHVVETKAAEMGVTLDAEDEAAIQTQLEEDMLSMCGEDATEEDFDKALESVYMNRETYDYITRIYVLYNKLYAAVCGENGEKLSQADIDACIADNQYVTVKHILISTLDAEGNPLEGQDLAEKTALATLLLTQLQEVQDDKAALTAKFDELMNQYSEDTGLPYYPGGYTFRPGEMVEEFETASNTLKDYELYPELVTSDYGYHIILRLPTTRDSVVTYVDPTTSYTIGSYAAASTFSSLLSAWMDEADVTWSGAFETMTAEKVFE